MIDYIIMQSIWCGLFLLTGLFLVWRYRVQLSRPAIHRADRQRLFALRDRAILLVAEGRFREDDPNWQRLYRTLNHSAKAASVAQMKNGLSYVWRLLRLIKPISQEDRRRVEQLPEPLLKLWFEYIVTVFSIILAGSFVVRLALRLAHRFGFVKRWMERQLPKEMASYQEWETSAEDVRGFRNTSSTTPTAVGSC